MEPNLELSKTRDFSQIISDSFTFIRQNLKPLLACFFVICGFLLLATAVAAIAQQSKLADAFNNPDFAARGPVNWTYFGIEGIVSIVLSILLYVTMPLTILSFMAVYKEKGNLAPSVPEVWAYVKYYFFRVLGGSIVNLVVMIIGFMLCVIPGIYFYPILALIVPIMIMENTGYGFAWSKAFRIIKQNWWTVFGALFVTWLITAVCGTVLSIPFAAANVWSVFMGRIPTIHLTMFTIIAGAIVRQIILVLYILPVVTLGICYFSLDEAKDATGLMNRIDQLGNNTTDTEPAEEY